MGKIGARQSGSDSRVLPIYQLFSSATSPLGRSFSLVATFPDGKPALHPRPATRVTAAEQIIEKSGNP